MIEISCAVFTIKYLLMGPSHVIVLFSEGNVPSWRVSKRVFKRVFHCLPPTHPLLCLLQKHPRLCLPQLNILAIKTPRYQTDGNEDYVSWPASFYITFVNVASQVPCYLLSINSSEYLPRTCLPSSSSIPLAKGLT